MPVPPIDERRFTDQEVREILQKAVKKSPPGRKGSLVRSEGLSLVELQSIAEEAGLDPARIETAAREVALKRSNRPGHLLGAPLVTNVERRVDGEFAPEDTPEILSVIRRTMGQQGDIAEIYGSLEWSAATDSEERLVTLSARDGATTIRSSSNLGNLAVLTFVPAGFLGVVLWFVGLTQVVQGASTIGFVLFFAILPALYLILRTLFARFSDAESAKLEQVVDELARLTGESEQ